MTTRLSQDLRSDLGLLLIRSILAVVFLFHGSQKVLGAFGGGGFEGTVKDFESMGLPFPAVSAALCAAAEFLGGFALLLGLFTRWAALALFITMMVAALHVHGHAFANSDKGMEFPLTLAVVSAGLALLGPGALSLDRAMRKKV